MTPEVIVENIKEAGGLAAQVEILTGLTEEQISQVVTHLSVQVEQGTEKRVVWAKILHTMRSWPKGYPASRKPETYYI